MQASYVGYRRMPWYMWIAMIFLVGAVGFFIWSLTQDAQYAQMLRDAPDDRDGWVIQMIPRPFLIAITILFELGFIGLFVIQVLAALQRRISFLIDANGVRSYGLFSGREKHLPWGQIKSKWKYKSQLSFKGKDFTGHTRRVTISLLGHSYKQIKAVIAAYRPDLV